MRQRPKRKRSKWNYWRPKNIWDGSGHSGTQHARKLSGVSQTPLVEAREVKRPRMITGRFRFK